MSFNLIYGDGEKYMYFCGLYPKKFDALFAFLGPAKFNIINCNSSKSSMGFGTRSSIYKSESL